MQHFKVRPMVSILFKDAHTLDLTVLHANANITSWKLTVRSEETETKTKEVYWRSLMAECPIFSAPEKIRVCMN